MVYQNKNMWSIKTKVHFQRYELKSQLFKLLKSIFDTFMIVLASYKTVEDIYGIMLPIFIIFIMMQKIIRLLRNLIFKLLLFCLLYVINFK